MKAKFCLAWVLVVATFAIVLQTACATLVMVTPTERLVSQASFVGIVECETAGGIVATYRVIESWKGAAVGTRFNLKTPYSFWGPQFPFRLVGERVVITAFADEVPTRLLSTTSGGAVPLWWRKIPYEYSLPLFQGVTGVPDKPDKSYDGFGKQYSGFEAFRTHVKKLAGMSPEQIEVEIMRNSFLQAQPKPAKTDSAVIKSLKHRIATATTAAQLVNALLTLKWKEPKTSISSVLYEGGAETLKFLLTLKDSQWPLGKSRRDRIMEEVQRRAVQETRTIEARNGNELQEEEMPAPETLSRMREILNGTIKPNVILPIDELMQAFGTLTKHDPGVVEKYLVNWKNHDTSVDSSDRGYVLGSYFAWRCAGNREVHLRALSQAQDPFIRVAGAVYLCFENLEEGTARLQKLQYLPGDPGAWAALTLARRGDKSALPRALQVFETAGIESMSGVSHRNLQKRILVLLSNSAKKSDIALPPAFTDYLFEGNNQVISKKNFQIFEKWWQDNLYQISLHDPWLPLLEIQKVD